MTSFNKESSIPIYVQIKKMLANDIDSGKLLPHTRVPSENELVKSFGVSRMTINKVMTELTRDGILYRRQGKGTFVSQKKIDQWFFRITSFKQDMIQRGLDPKTSVIEKKVITASSAVAAQLKVKAAEKVIFIKRLRYANDEPIMIESRYLNYKWCRKILNEPLETESIHNLLIQKYRLPLTKVHQYLEAIKINDEEAGYLGIDPGEPGFLLCRTTFTAETPVTWVNYIYRGDRYRFYAEFNPVE
jgi:GntR family transcriptional regulator